jgi:prepilin-type N-terminal cleavage/methylation domain-containing protein
MRRGFSLTEMAVVIAVAGLVTGITLPHLRSLADWIAVDTAAREVTTALATARHAAVMRATRSRLVIGADSLRVDRWGTIGWEPLIRWAGPEDHGVDVAVSNPEIVFGPTGIGWAVSNTQVVLRRGSRYETVTVSRVGRVKRW